MQKESVKYRVIWKEAERTFVTHCGYDSWACCHTWSRQDGTTNVYSISLWIRNRTEVPKNEWVRIFCLILYSTVLAVLAICDVKLVIRSRRFDTAFQNLMINMKCKSTWVFTNLCFYSFSAEENDTSGRFMVGLILILLLVDAIRTLTFESWRSSVSFFPL